MKTCDVCDVEVDDEYCYRAPVEIFRWMPGSYCSECYIERVNQEIVKVVKHADRMKKLLPDAVIDQLATEGYVSAA